MQHLLRPILATVLVAACMFWPLTAHAQLTVGVSLPLSGAISKLALQFETGARLALEDHNLSTGQNVSMFVADDGCDEELASLAAEDIREQNPGIITGMLCNAVATHFANAFLDEGMPLLVAGAQSERLIKDRERNEWKLWRLSPGDSEAAEIAVSHFARAWAGVPYAIVDDGTVYGRNLADTFRSGMEEVGLPPQFQDNFRPTQSTQARMVRRLVRAGVTHAFVGASAEDVAMIASNAEELEINLQLGSGEALSIFPYLDTELLPGKGVTAILKKAEVSQEVPQGLAERLAAMDRQAEPYVLLGYQAMQVAIQALAPTTEATIGRLNQFRFDTVLGDVAFDASGDNSVPQFAPYRWQNGRFERIGE